MDQKDNDPLSSIRTEGGMLQQGNGRKDKKDIADHSGTEALRKERTVDTCTLVLVLEQVSQSDDDCK